MYLLYNNGLDIPLENLKYVLLFFDDKIDKFK